MAGFRVSTDVHHNPTGPEGRPHMVVLNGWCIWHLSDEELRDLSAQALMELARTESERNQLAAEADRIAADDRRRFEELMDNDSWPIDAGSPDMPHLTEAMD